MGRRLVSTATKPMMIDKSLGENAVIRYIGKLFDIKPFKEGKFHRWETACDYIIDNQIPVPEGLVESRFIHDRVNVAGTVWNLSTRCQLLKDAQELFDENNQCYMLVTDSCRSGEDSLFLMACGMYADTDEIRDDSVYHLRSWASFCENDGPMVVSGGKRLKEGIFFMQALNLASMKRKQRE